MPAPRTQPRSRMGEHLGHDRFELVPEAGLPPDGLLKDRHRMHPDGDGDRGRGEVIEAERDNRSEEFPGDLDVREGTHHVAPCGVMHAGLLYLPEYRGKPGRYQLRVPFAGVREDPGRTLREDAIIPEEHLHQLTEPGGIAADPVRDLHGQAF